MMDTLTPNDTALIASELAELMARLAVLDLAPIERATDIEHTRRQALAFAETLAGYLLVSDAFAPVDDESEL